MTIYAFIVDTSVSMKQPLEPVGLGGSPLSCLEIAKAGIEHFYKLLVGQNRLQEDDYFLLATYDSADRAIKSNLKDSREFFLSQVKHLKAENETFDVGRTFHAVFEHLHCNWVNAGYDTSGYGKFVGWYEMTFIFWFTNAERAASTLGIEGETIVIPALRSPGAPHFLEPFRWDQRLYPILLQSEQFTAPPHFLGQISSMTSDMCGEVYFVNSARHVIWCVENIVGGARMRVHVGVEPQRPVVFETGVQVNWELLDSEGEEGQVFKTLIHHDKRKQNYATFPIPEPYFCGLGLANIPNVSAIPLVSVLKADTSLTIPNGVITDRFAVGYSEMTAELATRPTGTCWMVFVRNSGPNQGLGLPFGFFKMNSTKSTIHLHVFPYDVKNFFNIFVGCYRTAPITPSRKWAEEFREYLASIPVYEWQPIRTLLKKVEQTKLFPDTMLKQFLARPIHQITTRIKNEAKSEWAGVEPVQHSSTVELRILGNEKPTTESIRARLITDPSLVSGADLFSKLNDMRIAIFQAFDLPIPRSSSGRRGLVPQNPAHDPPGLRELPVSKMGDHDNYPKKPQLRNPFMTEEEEARWNKLAFGNPYRMFVDREQPVQESDEAANEALTINFVRDDGDNDDAMSVDSNDSQTSASGLPVRRKRPRSVTPPRRFDPTKLPRLTLEYRKALGFDGDELLLTKKQAQKAGGGTGSEPGSPVKDNNDKPAVEKPAISIDVDAGRKRKLDELDLDDDDDEELYGPSTPPNGGERRPSQPSSPLHAEEQFIWNSQENLQGPLSSDIGDLLEMDEGEPEAAAKSFYEWRKEISLLFHLRGPEFSEPVVIDAMRRCLTASYLPADDKERLREHCVWMCDSFRKPAIKNSLNTLGLL